MQRLCRQGPHGAAAHSQHSGELGQAIGIGVGLLVNAVVWPPLRRRTAITAIDRVDDRIGQLLSRMAEELRQSVARFKIA